MEKMGSDKCPEIENKEERRVEARISQRESGIEPQQVRNRIF